MPKWKVKYERCVEGYAVVDTDYPEDARGSVIDNIADYANPEAESTLHVAVRLYDVEEVPV